MKVGYVQTSPIFGDKQTNFKEIESLLSGEKADLIVLPELFATGYTFATKGEVVSLAENLEGETAEFLKNLSFKTDSVVVGGFIEKENEKVYNSSIIAYNDEIIGTYRKIHLYYKEKVWFSSGNRHLKVYEAKGMKIGIMICFDWIFPEVARSLSVKGADIIAHPANLVLPYCQNAMITRCLENHVYGVTANRIGEENRGDDNFKFTGKSQITSYNGEVLSSAPANQRCVDFINIDIKKARVKQLNEFNNVFNDRKPEFY
ncbi:MAG: nitrilase-related carbon-nitrogen hydrolase [Candidatus Thorarchaeota archaeon]